MPETKSSGVGIVLSFFLTGLGQLYAGRIQRGLTMMMATPIVWIFSLLFASMLIQPRGLERIFESNVIIGLLSLPGMLAGPAWWIWGMVDAKNLCEASNRAVLEGRITPSPTATSLQEL